MPAAGRWLPDYCSADYQTRSGRNLFWASDYGAPAKTGRIINAADSWNYCYTPTMEILYYRHFPQDGATTAQGIL